VVKFFKKMLSAGDEVSSKRVASFFVLVNLIALAYISTFNSKDGITPSFIFDALSLIAGGGLGLTVIEKIFKKSTNEIESPPPQLNSTEEKQTTLEETQEV
jgi:hypothetical protein